jgi:hypothetical protein
MRRTPEEARRYHRRSRLERLDISPKRIEHAPDTLSERIKHASEIVVRLSQIAELNGWVATFRRDNVEFTGLWPPDADLDGTDFEVPIEAWVGDPSDLAGSYERHRERCLLAIQQGLMRANFQLRLVPEAIKGSRAVS